MPARTLRTFGGLLYRLLVGLLVSVIVVGAAEVVLMAGFYFGLQAVQGTLAGLVAVFCLFGASLAGFVGAVAAALVAAHEPPGRKPALWQWASLGSLLGLGFGATVCCYSAVFLGMAFELDQLRRMDNLPLVPVGLGVAAGLLAGIAVGWYSRRPQVPDPDEEEGTRGFSESELDEDDRGTMA
jgi:hypothetical protein